MWIDLNAPHSRETRQLARTLREGRIARGPSSSVGDSARSGLLVRVGGAFSTDRLNAVATALLMVAVMVSTAGLIGAWLERAR